MMMRVKPIIEKIFSRVSHDVYTANLEGKSLFVNALLGRVSLVNSRAERLVVTLIGENAVRIVKPFFKDVRLVKHPFDFEGTLERNGKRYTVKVVSGVRAFNSTTKKAVEKESQNVVNPIIITLQGSFIGTHVKYVGRAIWYDGVSTWSLLTGKKNAYRDFVTLVYDTARPYRGKIIKRIIDEVSRGY